MTLQPLKSQVSQLSAGTICSIAKKEPMFSQMNCAEYTNSERIHSAFTAYVQSIEPKVSVWQDAWASLLEFATTQEAADRMSKLLTEQGFSCTAPGTIDSWQNPQKELVMIDKETGVIARKGSTEPFFIQEGFFLCN